MNRFYPSKWWSVDILFIDHRFQVVISLMMTVLLVAFGHRSFSQTWSPTQLAKGPGSAYMLAMGIDQCGNRIALGEYHGSTSFDQITIEGDGYFLAKYDVDDKVVWAEKIASVQNKKLNLLPNDNKVHIAEPDGDIIIALNLEQGGVANFNGITVDGTTEAKLVLAKYDKNGNASWLRNISMGISSDYAHLPLFEQGGLACDADIDLQGNTIITGRFVGNLNFGNGATISSGTTCQSNAFLVKFGSGGSTLWAKSLGSTYFAGDQFCNGSGDNEWGTHVVTYNQAIYLSGSYNHQCNFDGMLINSNDTNSLTAEIFLSKFTSEGVVEWLKDIGGSSGIFDRPTSLERNENGDLYIGLTLRDSGTFGGQYFSSGGLTDALWMKYSSEGQLMNFYNEATSVYEDAKRLIIVSGKIYTDRLVFDSNFNVVDQIVWVFIGPDPSSPRINGGWNWNAAGDRFGSVFFYGAFKNSDVSPFTSTGEWDGYYARYGPGEKPDITPAANQEICEGTITTLTATGSYSNFQWSGGQLQTSIQVGMTGTYSVRGIRGQGCLGPASAPVAVKIKTVPEKPVIAVTGSLSFCHGQNVTLSVPTGFSGYKWSDNSATSFITVNSGGMYSIRTVNECGESVDSDPVTVVVHEPPKPVITSSRGNQVCASEAGIPLDAPQGFAGYLWSTGETAQEITVHSSGTKNFWVKVRDQNNCYSEQSDLFTLTVLEVPNYVLLDYPDGYPPDDGQGNKAICNGNSIRIQAAILDDDPSQFDLMWSSGETSEGIVVSTPGLYSVAIKYKNGNGCYSDRFFSQDNFVAMQKPVKPAIGTPNGLVVCDNSSIELTAPQAFNGWTVWSTGDYSSSIQVTESGVYTLTLINACGETTSDPLAVSAGSIPEKPVIAVDGNLSFCSGGSVKLSGPEGYAGYKWSDNSATSSITVGSGGMYSIRTVNECGESADSDPVVVNIYPIPQKPVVVSNVGNAVCLSEQNAKLEAPQDQNEYLWSTGETTSSISADLHSSGVKNFWAKVKNENNCFSEQSDDFVLTVLPRPKLLIDFPDFQNPSGTPPIDDKNNFVLCNGNSVKVRATILEKTSAYDLLWSTGETSENISVSYRGSYSVIAKYKESGCSSDPYPISFELAQSPAKPVIDAPNGSMVCDNREIVLAAPTGSSGWRWSTGEVSSFINVTVPASYTLTVSNACGRSAPSDAIVVTSGLSPNKPVVTFNSNNLTFCDHRYLTLSASSISDGYRWSTGATSKTITINSSGDYWVKTFNSCGESELSDVVSLIARHCPEADIFNFQNIEVTYGDKTFEFSAKTNSSTPIQFAIVGADNSGEIALSGLRNEVASPMHAGFVKVRASVDEDENYRGAYKDILISIQKAKQAISFETIPSKLFNDSPFQVTASSTSGLDVSFQSTNPIVAAIEGNTVSILAPGQSDIIARQAGNRDYEPAADVIQLLTVKTITGVEKSGITSMNVFPNPTTNYLVIEMADIEGANFSVFDTQGRCFNIPVNEGANGKRVLNVEMLSSGMYYLEIRQGQSRTGWRFIKK